MSKAKYKHPNEDLILAILGGKTVEVQNPPSKVWNPVVNGDSDFAYRLLFPDSPYTDPITDGVFFRIKKPTTIINGFTLLDDRVTEKPENVASVYCECLSAPEFCYGVEVRHMPNIDLINGIKCGILHHTKEGAIAFCKARLGHDAPS